MKLLTSKVFNAILVSTLITLWKSPITPLRSCRVMLRQEDSFLVITRIIHTN